MILDFLQDALFSAIAAIGFASISNPPRRAYIYCAILAAVGHSIRWILMQYAPLNIHITVASAIAAFITGSLAVLFSSKAHVPAETFIFPALLPMIPGMYAYRCFGALMMSLLHSSPDRFGHYFYLFASNGLTCLFILLALAIGATIPIFLFRKKTYQATRSRRR